MFQWSGKGVPVAEHFEGQFETGQTLTVYGTPKGDRFDINLKAADGKIPFHMSSRIGEKKFVFNSFDNGAWGNEEKASLNFKETEPFRVHIRPQQDKYEIYCNGKKVHDFEHRQSLNTVQGYAIEGACSLLYAGVGGKYMSMPYEANLHKAFNKLDVQGIVDKDCQRFEIDLSAGGDHIALHINPRFGEKAIVLNAKDGSGWGKEERNAGTLPFEKGEIFDLSVVSSAASFAIHINGKEFTTFAHRINPSQIKGVKVQGDMILTNVVVS